MKTKKDGRVFADQKMLRVARMFVGMSQQVLARKVGYTQPGWALIEGGHRRISKTDAEIVAKTLKMNVELLFVGQDRYER